MLRVRTDFTPSNYLTEIVFRSKSSRPNTIGSDTMYNEDLIKEAVQKELDNYNNNHLSNNQYTTVNKDGKKMAVINADELEDGLIIVPGMIIVVCLHFRLETSIINLNIAWAGKNKNFTVLEEVNASELNTKYRTSQVYPYDRRYTRGDQTDDQYSLNVLNLEGETELAIRDSH